GRPDSLPGASDLDEDTLATDPGLLVQSDKPVGLNQGSFGVKAESGIHFGGHPTGDDLEDLAAKTDQQLVHESLRARRPVAGRLYGVLDRPFHEMLVLGHPGRLVEQRGVRGRILGPVLGDRLEIAGVGHHRGKTLQRVNEVHRDSSILCFTSCPLTGFCKTLFGLQANARGRFPSPSHRRKPPTNAFALSPSRVPEGSPFSFLTFPPPRTTSSGLR